MRWQSSKVAFTLGLLILWLAAPAKADLEICNDTESKQSVAVGYKLDGDWVSEGWWALEPGSCVIPIAGELKYRFYYYRAEAAGWDFKHDRISFCTADTLFTVRGDGECEPRGYVKSYFAKVDTGKGTDRFTQLLSDHLTRISGQAGSDSDTLAGTWGMPFTGDANFHGCTPLFDRAQRVCSFVGGGRKFNVSDDGRTGKALFATLETMTPGEPVQLEGDWSARFESTVELVLRRVSPRPANSEDEILFKLAGRWYSVADANDQFTVFGSGRQNTYDGSQTSMEYLSVMQHCGEFLTEGPYLYAWDSQGGTGLCYVVHELTHNELVLTYLPRGTQLHYRKVVGEN